MDHKGLVLASQNSQSGVRDGHFQIIPQIQNYISKKYNKGELLGILGGSDLSGKVSEGFFEEAMVMLMSEG